MKVNPDKIVHSSAKIASLPAIFFRLQDEIHSINSNNASIARILEEDPGMSARTLRLANSALFNFPSKIESIARAISIIGHKQLLDIVFASSIVHAFKGLNIPMVDMQSFWTHSMSCGVAARVIAGIRNEPNTERLFAAGLLHDIGRLILILHHPEEINAILKEMQNTEVSGYELEIKHLGFDHGYLAGLLLRHWQLPPVITQAVQYHHAPHRNKDFKLEALTIKLADFIAHGLGHALLPGLPAPSFDPTQLELLGIEPSHASIIIEQTDELVTDLMNFILDDRA